MRVNPKPCRSRTRRCGRRRSHPIPTRCAKRGLKILTSPAFTPLDILRKNYDAYHAEWKTTHGTADGAEICMNKIIYVAETSKQAREDLREPVLWFFRTQADLIADPQGAPPEQYRFYKRVRENLLSLTEEKALDQAAIVGEPEEVADKIRQHADALGVSYFMGAFSRRLSPTTRSPAPCASSPKR